jgi:hypothetical protein
LASIRPVSTIRVLHFAALVGVTREFRDKTLRGRRGFKTPGEGNGIVPQEGFEVSARQLRPRAADLLIDSGPLLQEIASRGKMRFQGFERFGLPDGSQVTGGRESSRRGLGGDAPAATEGRASLKRAAGRGSGPWPPKPWRRRVRGELKAAGDLRIRISDFGFRNF